MPGGGESAPLRFFLHDSKTPGDIKKKLSDFNFTPLTVILSILPITIVVRCCHSNLLFPACHVIFGVEKAKKLELFSRSLLDQAQIRHRGLILGSEFKFVRNFNVWRHFDVTMTKRQNTHISETEKVYCVIMTSFFNQNTWNFVQGLLGERLKANLLCTLHHGYLWAAGNSM